MQLSSSPKLWEMTSPKLLSITCFVALRMSASAFDFASTKVMFAPGAMAFAHITSSEISWAHRDMLASLGTNGVNPSGASWVDVPKLGFVAPPSPFKLGRP